MAKIEMIGKKYGRLVVIEEAEPRKNSREAKWICKCECGKVTRPISGYDLRNGHTKSCGCFMIERVTEKKTIHGKCGTRLYNIFSHMKRRCYDTKHPFYNHYGGRGISICDEWCNNFQAFYDWSMKHGYKENLSIDRINNDGNYSPDNCRWATPEMQNNNMRSNILIEIDGETRTLAQWGMISGISSSTIRARYKKGVRGTTLLKQPRKRVQNAL